MKRLSALVVASLCLLAGSASGGPEAATAGGTCPVGDPAGDAGTGPDVTAVHVSNDAGGRISFRIDIANRPQPAPDDILQLNIDDDLNFDNGWYVIDFLGSTRSFRLFRWNRSAFEPLTPASLAGSYTSSGLSVSISSSDLRGTRAFWYWVWAWHGPDSGAPGRFDNTPTTLHVLEETLYADPAGDGGAAPDITCVHVSNNDAGQLFFKIDHPTTVLPEPQETRTSTVHFALFLDTDRNPRTGATAGRGAEYMLDLNHGTRQGDVLRWTGSQWRALPSSTASWGSRHTFQTLSIDRSDLGGTQGFNFWLRFAEGPELFGRGQADEVPDSGSWSYGLTATQPVSLNELVNRVRTGVVRIEVVSCQGKAVGSGILVGARHVATVEHVVARAKRIVLTRDGRALGTASVVGHDRGRDLALLQTKRPIAGYRFPLSRQTPQVGDPVAVLGYPAGLPLSVTRGSVSGLNRSIRIDGVTRRALLQTDAAVNRGNSGGPLLAVESGALLGLVDIGSAQANGIAFAVSAQTAGPLLNAWKASPQPRPPARCR